MSVFYFPFSHSGFLALIVSVVFDQDPENVEVASGSPLPGLKVVIIGLLPSHMYYRKHSFF